MSDSDDQDKTRIRKPIRPKKDTAKTSPRSGSESERNARASGRQTDQVTRARQSVDEIKSAKAVKRREPTEYNPAQKAKPKPQAPGSKSPSSEKESSIISVPPLRGKNIPQGGGDKTLIDVNPNDTLKNRFVLERVLGAGGMGVVYKAKDLLKVEAHDRDPWVAIKVLGEEFKSHPEAFIALQRESRKTQRIAHPNIVNVYDFDKDRDTVFMTMEFLEGTPLDKMIKKYRTHGLPMEDVWQILGGLCAALSYAHEQNIIHSDLKPGNIFVTHQGVTKVFDFGIARAVAKAEQGDNAEEDRTIFDAGNLGALTPAYASLEMLEGDTPDVRDDIYALGCIAYELFTGEHPFKRKNAQEALRKNLKAERIEGITKHQWRVIESALAFERENRIATVKEFWAELNKKKNTPVGLWFASSAAVIFLGAGAYLYQQNQNIPPPQPVQPEFSETEFRNEIEQQIRIELVQDNLSKLLEEKRFTSAWHEALITELNALRTLLGKDSESYISAFTQSVEIYSEKIEQEITDKNFKEARVWLSNSKVFAESAGQFAEFSQIIETEIAKQEQIEAQEKAKREAELKKQQEQQRLAQQQASQRKTFENALASVNEQLDCNRLLDMDDFAKAINTMKNADRQKYSSLENNIVKDLSACINKIANNFPSRAKTAREDAIALFKGHAALESIRFESKDPCPVSLAGLGSRGKRGTCLDNLNSGGKAPRLVVIPGRGSVEPFAIGRYEVTVDEFNEFCGATTHCKILPEPNPSLPATNVSSDLVDKYVAWLSDETGRVYRLPTLFEWQYAAKAKGRPLDANRNCTFKSRGIQLGGALVNASIGQQNAWGLVNYVGNAMEWVRDRDGSLLAVGGSYATDMSECSIDSLQKSSGSPNAEVGFRIVRELKTQ